MNREPTDPVLRRWLGATAIAHVIVGVASAVFQFGPPSSPGLPALGGWPLAVIFFVSGASFWAFAGGRRALGRGWGGLLAGLGLVTLFLGLRAEMLDPAALSSGLSPTVVFGGWPPPGVAASAWILGVLLSMMGWRVIKVRTLIAGAALLLAIGFADLCGDLTGLKATFAWWRFVEMGWATVAVFLAAGGGVLLWVLRQMPAEDRYTARSLPFFAVAGGLIVAVTAVSLASNEAERENRRRVGHTWEVRANIDRFISAMARMEATTRRYLLTGEEVSLARYETYQAELRQQLDALDQLVASNPSQASRVRELRPLVAEKFASNDAQLRAYEQGGTAAAMQVLASTRPGLLPSLSRITGELEQEEKRLLAQREASTTAAQRGASLILAVGVTVTTALLGLAFFLVHQAKIGLRNANKTLEQRVLNRTAQLQQANADLRESERSVQFLADTIPQLVWTADLDGKMIGMNQRWADFTGTPTDELLSRSDLDIVHPGDVEAERAMWATMIAGEQEGAGEYRLRDKDGNWRWHLWRGRPQRGPDKAVIRWVGTSTDIHGQKQAGELLEQRVTERTREISEIRARLEEAYRFQSAVLDSTSFALVVTSAADGLIRIFNGGAERMLGWRREEVVGLRQTNLFYDQQEVATRAARLSAQLGREIKSGCEVFVGTSERGEPIENELTLLRKDGSGVPSLFTVQTLHGSAGETTGYLTVIHDVTERRAAAAAQRVSEERLRLFAAHAPASVAMFDRDMRYLVVSQRWLVDYKLEGQDLVGRSHYEVFPEIGEHWKAAHQRCLAGAIESSEAEEFTRFDRSKQWLHWEVRPWHDAAGKIGGIVMFTQDITERKTLENNLAQARDEALEGSRLKSQFLATMSHEIRTPMNGVLGMMSLMLETPLAPDQLDMARVIQGSAESLLTIIDDILDFSRIEAGQLRIAPIAFDLRALVKATAALLQPRIQQKKLGLTCEVDPQLAGNFMGDASRIRQVVMNLLGNAVKFTETGEVSLRAKLLRGDTRGVVVRVSVQDSGIGIPMEARDKLFQPFTQGDGSVTRRFGGTGLGLAITRQLVALLGGTIGFESEPGHGSLFWFELALERVAGATHDEDDHRPSSTTPSIPALGTTSVPAKVGSTRSEAKGSRGLDVLLVEDNRANQLVARMMLGKMGHTAEIASDGEQALVNLAGRAFDVVLMDCQMPVLDGYEATRRIRAGAVPGANVRIPIIAITAHAMAGDREKCLAAGMDDYITKPVSMVELGKALERCGLGRNSSASKVASTGLSGQVLNSKVRELVRALPGRAGPSLWPEMVELFLQDQRVSLSDIERLADQADLAGLGAAAKRLAGIAAGVGGEQARQAAEAVELAAKGGQQAVVAARIGELLTASDALREALQQEHSVSA